MLVIGAKLEELEQRLSYLRQELKRCRQGAHANLAARLTLRLKTVAQLSKDLAAVRTKFSQYQSATNPDFDVWKQIFAQFSDVANKIHSILTVELPIYLASSSNDEFASNILGAIHKEVGLPHVKPVATLHQSGWWAVLPNVPDYPLFYTPASVLVDPGELPLIFHEIGHVLYRRDTILHRQAAQVLQDTVLRKYQEAQRASDPTDRANKLERIKWWAKYSVYELEETCCDVVGNLLGGPAFATALAVGLLTGSNALFQFDTSIYPPLDVRMRLSTLVLRHSGVDKKSSEDDRQLSRIEDSWASVQEVYRPSQPPLYSWIYDDQYLEELTTAIIDYLEDQGLALYEPGIGGLRQEMTIGARARLNSPAEYDTWAQAFSASLLKSYS